MPGTIGEDAFRAFYREGRITDADLDHALRRRYPNLAEESELVRRPGDRPVRPAQSRYAARLGCHPPEAALHHPPEDHEPTVAETIDAQTSKRCAAFFGGAAWPMPGRENGFYAAWRALAPSDRTVGRTARGKLRRVAERPDDAVLKPWSDWASPRMTASRTCRPTTCMPGWAAHIQWCSGRGAGIDLLGYLAMRLTYETVLLHRQPGPGPAGRTDEAVIAPPRGSEPAT